MIYAITIITAFVASLVIAALLIRWYLRVSFRLSELESQMSAAHLALKTHKSWHEETSAFVRAMDEEVKHRTSPNQLGDRAQRSAMVQITLILDRVAEHIKQAVRDVKEGWARDDEIIKGRKSANQSTGGAVTHQSHYRPEDERFGEVPVQSTKTGRS